MHTGTVGCNPIGGIRLMTISPEEPKLQDSQKEGWKILVEPHLTFVNVGFGYSLMVLIGEGFETDGASVPKKLLYDNLYGKCVQGYLHKKYPKIGTRWDMENLWESLIGKPWDMPRLLAAIVHDALYAFQWKCRWLCDMIYRRILLQNNYERVRADIEYMCISLVGWKHWKNVSDLKRDKTRKIVKIEFVRTKKIPQIVAKLKG
jgi:hypothetical protein